MSKRPERKKTSKQALQLSKQRQITDALEKLLKATTARFPHDPISPMTTEAWMRDWARIIDRVGLKRFTDGLMEACLHSKYFPLPAVILEHLPEPKVKENNTCTEMRELQARAAAGEQFFGLADVMRELRMKLGANAAAKKLDPNCGSEEGRDS